MRLFVAENRKAAGSALFPPPLPPTAAGFLPKVCVKLPCHFSRRHFLVPQAPTLLVGGFLDQDARGGG
ncbi:hypothetical protein SLEP1_g3163 [Rubroshorea leprosula]|uniref:Uncharacterized protein n=1 Tax=Rubroshorea leprosula TaxID=152421 RepID=A0AAV5HJJ2_9ROSI|nr:hypothetical protein SLEP1_g3163 [Rubroshorea leprosula]